MKNQIPVVIGLVCAQLMAGAGLAVAGTNETNAPQRIGVYDSRVVAFAHFWSAENQARQREQMKAAHDAKAAGDTNRFDKLAKELAAEQRRGHRQVFSTAPADEALAALQPRLAAIEKEAGVSALVSKWDQPALASRPRAAQVDVTDLLAREFKPDEKRLKTIEEIKKQKPVPLDQIDRMKDAD
jgi:hypothetical protein